MKIARDVELRVEMLAIGSLKLSSNNARTHSRKQIDQIAASIASSGFNNPVLISDDSEIVAGHGRVAAAKKLGVQVVPVIRLAHLTPAQQRAYRLADNKIAMNSGWDFTILANELSFVAGEGLSFENIGFSTGEVDQIILRADSAEVDGPTDAENVLPRVGVPITRPGDVWILGNHRLICGDARDRAVYDVLLEGNDADLVIADPPFNLPIDQYVVGPRGTKHVPFLMANGEMSSEHYRQFLTRALHCVAERSKPGAIAYVFMDWRHMGEMLAAGKAAFQEQKNLVVWNKTNAGMGNFYRAKHELIFVYKTKPGKHQNNFNLGENGRYRTNVWDYAGVASFGGNGNRRIEDLSLHPTVKPVSLIADAIKDTSKRGDIVIDPFGGSGTTLIAAETTGRRSRLIEIEPNFSDVILRRWREFTGREPVLEDSGQTLADKEAEAQDANAPDIPIGDKP